MDLKKLRHALGLSQPELAALLGTHAMTVSKWERGKLEPGAHHRRLLGAFARGPLRCNPSADELESFYAQLKLIEVGWGQDNPAFRQLFTNQFFPNATPEQVHSFNDLQRMSCAAPQAARIVRAFSDIDASAHLAKVACPTLVLHTRGDMCAPFEEGLFMASSIPGARLVPLETRSHVPTPGEPSFERMLEEINGFIGLERAGDPLAFPALTGREREILQRIWPCRKRRSETT